MTTADLRAWITGLAREREWSRVVLPLTTIAGMRVYAVGVVRADGHIVAPPDGPRLYLELMAAVIAARMVPTR